MIKSHADRRKSRRERADITADLIWKDESGQRRSRGRIVDISRTGAAVATLVGLPASSHLVLRGTGGGSHAGLLTLVQVRNCSRVRTQYRLGVEFFDLWDFPVAGYLDLLRAGTEGDLVRLDQFYRTLAFRYHPDNSDTGNSEVFLRVKEAFRILSPTPTRPEQTGLAKSGVPSRESDEFGPPREQRTQVLRLLYDRRATDYRNATVSAYELETLTGLSSDQLGFALWYLLEKGAVALSGYSTDYGITATGVDSVETGQHCGELRPAPVALECSSGP